MHWAILEMILDWLDSHSIQIICCGYQDQPSPIVGKLPYNWLQQKVDYYKEVEVDPEKRTSASRPQKCSARRCEKLSLTLGMGQIC